MPYKGYEKRNFRFFEEKSKNILQSGVSVPKNSKIPMRGQYSLGTSAKGGWGVLNM
jgi:hypothetical protein